MRVTSMLPDIQYAIQQSNQSLATALQQVSTGNRVNQLSDDPAASANMVRSLASSANVDQYTANVSALQSRLQTADSAISSVVTSLNQAITLGTEGATSTTSTTDRQAIATQVQGILSDVVSQANASYQVPTSLAALQQRHHPSSPTQPLPAATPTTATTPQTRCRLATPLTSVRTSPAISCSPPAPTSSAPSAA